jgi:hypothetical protein
MVPDGTQQTAVNGQQMSPDGTQQIGLGRGHVDVRVVGCALDLSCACRLCTRASVRVRVLGKVGKEIDLNVHMGVGVGMQYVGAICGRV